MPAVKQIVLDKDKHGKLLGMTIFYWGEEPPAMFFYNPPAQLRIDIEDNTNNTRVVIKKKHHATARR